MIAWFRNIQVAYMVTASLGGIPLAAGSVLQRKPILFLFAVLWIFFFAVLFSVIAQRKYAGVIKLMNEECRIAEYIEQTNKILNRCKNKKARNLLLLNLSAGYLNTGNVTCARQIFDRLMPFPDSARGAYEKAVYLNNLCLYHLLVRDFENAELALTELKKTIENPRLPQQQKNWLFDFYANRSVSLRMAKGDFEGAEQHFQLAAEKQNTRLTKIAVQYELAKAYIHAEKTEEAQKVFFSVAEQGGDSRYAALAKQELAAIEKL